MTISTVISIALALAAKAPAIYSDLKDLIEMIGTGKEPTPEQIDRLKAIIAKNELDIDNA